MYGLHSLPILALTAALFSGRSTCQNATTSVSVSAPAPEATSVPPDCHGGTGPGFTLDDATTAATSFCDMFPDLTKTNNHTFDFATYTITVSTEPVVPCNQNFLQEGTCPDFLLWAVNNCDTNTVTEKHGGLLEDNCITWSLY